MDEAKLIHKLQLLEALFADTNIEGERIAAGEARDRILKRLKELEREAPPVEYQFSIGDPWQRKIFLALLRRYGIQPYRRKGQRRTTVMARVTKKFVDETLWPEYLQFADILSEYLSEVTDRVLKTVLEQDTNEPESIEQEQLLLGV